MNVKKILAMILVLSLLVIGGVMQITAQKSGDSTPQGQSEEEIGNKGPDLDNVEEEFEGQDADDESDGLEEAKGGKAAEVENDGIVHEFEGEEEYED